jgi:hypothetical protein
MPVSVSPLSRMRERVGVRAYAAAVFALAKLRTSAA